MIGSSHEGSKLEELFRQSTSFRQWGQKVEDLGTDVNVLARNIQFHVGLLNQLFGQSRQFERLVSLDPFRGLQKRSVRRGGRACGGSLRGSGTEKESIRLIHQAWCRRRDVPPTSTFVRRTVSRRGDQASTCLTRMRFAFRGSSSGSTRTECIKSVLLFRRQ